MDITDKNIINILQEDARIPIQRLAKKVHMSGPSVNERIKKLEESGVIKGYRAALDAEQIGFSIHAFIIVNDSADSRKQINAYAQEERSIVRAFYSYAGGAELILEVYCRDLIHLDEIQRNLFELADTATYLVSAKAVKEETFHIE